MTKEGEKDLDSGLTEVRKKEGREDTLCPESQPVRSKEQPEKNGIAEALCTLLDCV